MFQGKEFRVQCDKQINVAGPSYENSSTACATLCNTDPNCIGTHWSPVPGTTQVSCERKFIDPLKTNLALIAINTKGTDIESKNDKCTTDLGTLKTKSDKCTTDFGTLKTKSDKCTTDFGTLKTKSDKCTTDLGTLKTKSDKCTTDFGTLKTKSDKCAKSLGTCQKDLKAKDKTWFCREGKVEKIGSHKYKHYCDKYLGITDLANSVTSYGERFGGYPVEDCALQCHREGGKCKWFALWEAGPGMSGCRTYGWNFNPGKLTRAPQGNQYRSGNFLVRV